MLYPLLLAGGLALRAGAATPPAGESTAITAAHAWWDAFAKGDAPTFSALSTAELTLTLSVGTAFDRDGALSAARSHAGSAYAGTAWSDDRVRIVGPGAAVVTSTATEGFGNMRTVFRYLTVLERQGAEWRVAVAQSTRVLSPTPRLPIADAGPLPSYAGRFRTPKGLVLEVKPMADHLLLVEPEGRERRLDPVAPDIFELELPQSASGVLRFLFNRDAAGRVSAVTRLGPQIATFPRVED
ncbi:hypothetical protein PAGU2595_010710 [Lysobacter xanthus]